ncbi:MAG: glutamate racemase [Chloroflexi bacterium]|nr:glutamate racemase [Chloroflexota bacterium]
MERRPIGVVDSGVGGIAVMREIRQLLPHEDIVYYADSANFPFGGKSVPQLQVVALEAARFLLSRRAKLIVVACNTLSSAALPALRRNFDVPFVGMVPAIKPASASTRTGRVGVIATEATVQAQVFADLVAQFAEGIAVFTRACPHLAETVERGDTDSPEVRRWLHEYIDPMLAQGIDTLVLGCTHYSFLRPAIEEIVGGEVTVIDPSLPVARQVERVLRDGGLAVSAAQAGKVEYFASADRDGLLTKAEALCASGSSLAATART